MNTSSSDQQGFSLIELIVYSLISSIILSVVAGIFVALNSVQSQVLESDAAATQAQVVSNSLKAGVRNAVALQLISDTSGQVLTAKSLDGEVTQGHNCIRWWFDPIAQSINVSYGDSSSQLAAPVSMTGWTQLSSMVSGVDSASVFQLADQTVNVNFVTNNVQGSPTEVNFMITQKNPVESGAPCF